MKEIISRIISFLFNIATEGPLIIYFALKLTPFKINFNLNLWLALGFIYFIPFMIYLFLLFNKKFSNWDISVLKERQRYNLIAAVLIISYFVVIYFIGNRNLLFYLLKIFLPFFAYFIITFFWQISSHTMSNTLFILLWYLYTKNSILILLGFFLVVLVGWSRLVLKKHTLAQVVAGSLLALIILLVV